MKRRQFNGEGSECQNAKFQNAKILILHSCASGWKNGAPILDQQAVGRLSRMDALQNQQMHLEQERRRLAELDRIEKTLSRIESANYGYCHNCGEAIEKKRLEFDPTTPLCVECAAHVSHS